MLCRVHMVTSVSEEFFDIQAGSVEEAEHMINEDEMLNPIYLDVYPSLTKELSGPVNDWEMSEAYKGLTEITGGRL